jgi:hypothetical protein
MRDTFFTLLAIFALLVLFPMLILWTRDKLRRYRRREIGSQRDARREAWRQRMLHPNVREVEALCDGLLPQKLLDMYADSGLLLSARSEVQVPAADSSKRSWWIEDFVPLHKQDQELTTDLTEFGKGCCFAGDGMGNFYWVPVDAERRNDVPVFFACHDPWGNEKVAETLEEFLSWPRIAKKNF